jgi:hypothetical protein
VRVLADLLKQLVAEPRNDDAAKWWENRVGLRQHHQATHSTPAFVLRQLGVTHFLYFADVFLIQLRIVHMFGKVRPVPAVFVGERHRPRHVLWKNEIVAM